MNVVAESLEQPSLHENYRAEPSAKLDSVVHLSTKAFYLAFDEQETEDIKEVCLNAYPIRPKSYYAGGAFL
jgi:hypothetical protein